MKEFKKFKVQDYLKHLHDYVTELPKEESYKLVHGVYLLWKDFDNFYKNCYGSHKRLDDLSEYLDVVQNAHIKKFLKDSKELPY